MLEMEGLDAFYGQSQALFGMSLSVEAGQVVSLMGRDGMGKTTTIRSIMGLIRPRGGSLSFQGQDLIGLAPYKVAQLGLGLVPEGRQIFPNLTVRENLVATARTGQGTSKPWTLDRVYELFPRLEDRQGSMGNQLSGGEQQMLAIARALVTGPRLIILDEPSEGLQPSAVTSFAGTLADIAEISGVTLLLVEQNLELVRDVAATCAFLVNGRIAAEVSTSGLGPGSSEVHQYLAL